MFLAKLLKLFRSCVAGKFHDCLLANMSCRRSLPSSRPRTLKPRNQPRTCSLGCSTGLVRVSMRHDLHGAKPRAPKHVHSWKSKPRFKLADVFCPSLALANLNCSCKFFRKILPAFPRLTWPGDVNASPFGGKTCRTQSIPWWARQVKAMHWGFAKSLTTFEPYLYISIVSKNSGYLYIIIYINKSVYIIFAQQTMTSPLLHHVIPCFSLRSLPQDRRHVMPTETRRVSPAVFADLLVTWRPDVGMITGVNWWLDLGKVSKLMSS